MRLTGGSMKKGPKASGASGPGSFGGWGGALSGLLSLKQSEGATSRPRGRPGRPAGGQPPRGSTEEKSDADRRRQRAQDSGAGGVAEAAIDDPVRADQPASVDDQVGGERSGEAERDDLALRQRPGSGQVEALDVPAQGLAGEPGLEEHAIARRGRAAWAPFAGLEAGVVRVELEHGSHLFVGQLADERAAQQPTALLGLDVADTGEHRGRAALLGRQL